MSLYDQANQSFSDIIAPFKTALSRYWKIAWAPSFVFLILGLLVSIKLPSYYSSDVLISIQQSRLSTKIVGAPNKEDQSERLQSLIFEMISRPRLVNILDQFKLYPDFKGASGRDSALKKLRNAITIDPESSTTGQRLSQTFRLSFTHNDPKVAYDVTKAISNLFIDESILNTKAETEGTVEFIESKLLETRQKLEATEKIVQDFQKTNYGKLPDNFQSNDVRLKSAQAQLGNNAQIMTAKSQKLEFLRQEMQRVSKELPAISADGATSNDPVEGLSQLESALAVLKTKYSDEHPDVISAKRRIEALRARIAKMGGGKGDKLVTKGSSEGRSIRREIGEIEAEISALNLENKQLKETIQQLESDIKEMPLKQQELIKIKRDYDNLRESYQKLQVAREDADMQRDLAASQKGTQFRIVDPPAIPTSPDGPPRMILAVSSVVLAFVLFIAICVTSFFLNDSFKFREQVELELGIPVIGIIPPMSTPLAIVKNQKSIYYSIVLSIVIFAIGTVAILLG